MDTIEFLIPSAPLANRRARHVGPRVRPAANLAATDFLATLLAMAGHDLRQPLQIITSAHDILATLLRGDKEREELAQAADATTQLACMLGQIVDAVQLHERPREDLAVPVLLWPIVEDMATEFDEAVRRKHIKFRITAARGTVLSDPVLLTSMLRNLIRNAIDYTPRGGSVFVASYRCGAELRINVRDTGIGIPARALSDIFAAFHRADNSRSDGLGLGLFIVKRAADLLGHRIEVRSDEGRGSRFTIIARAAQPIPTQSRAEVRSIAAGCLNRRCA